MKKHLLFLTCAAIPLLLASSADAQTLNRITFSSGGTSTNKLGASFGEAFGGTGNNVTVGSQQGSTRLSSVKTSPAQQGSFSLYPNPATETVHLHTEGVDCLGCVASIMETGGKLLSKTALKSPDVELSLANYAPGSYLIVLTDKNGKTLFSNTVSKK